MHQGKDILIEAFNSDQNPLKQFDSPQAAYLKAYLIGLNVQTVLVEQNYFDRDYLDEFSVFYSKSARGYPNICRRVHFFAANFDKKVFHSALEDSADALKILQDSYIGFTVLRPIKESPLGRTVLAWFPVPVDGTYRVTTPSREYLSIIGGIKLQVRGLAWQQQDSGVSACATIGIWTMLHSSAFDDHHSIPTTAAITQAAHEKASLGDRIFPSKGLKPHQILEAIKAQNLAPICCLGDKMVNPQLACFSPSKFASTCSSFIRSGYPVILLGKYLHEPQQAGHMVCVVGFKETGNYGVENGEVKPMDANSKIFYVHDDNVGPNVRCELSEVKIENENVCQLATAPPPYVNEQIREPKKQYVFLPTAIIVAVHEELRISSDDFYNAALDRAAQLSGLLNQGYQSNGANQPKLLFSSRFMTIRDYMANELPRLCDERKDILGKVRLTLMEQTPPISLHIGIIRIAILGDEGETELVTDIICDTTDSDKNQPIFAHIIFNETLTKLLGNLRPDIVNDYLGMQVIAHA